MKKLGYSVDDICELSGTGRDLVYSEINNGNLKSAKVGRRRIIRPEAAEQWLKDLEKATTEAMDFEEPGSNAQSTKKLSQGIYRRPRQRKQNSRLRDGSKQDDETENPPN